MTDCGYPLPKPGSRPAALRQLLALSSPDLQAEIVAYYLERGSPLQAAEKQAKRAAACLHAQTAEMIRRHYAPSIDAPFIWRGSRAESGAPSTKRSS